MNSRKTIKTLVLTTLLITLGQILNRFVPMFGISIRPDFSLVFLFICIAIEPTFKQAFIASAFTIILSIFFGLNPILQIPSFVDRFGSALFILIVLKSITLFNKKRSRISMSILFSIGTLVSGILYIGSSYVFANLIGIQEIQIVFQIGIIPLLTVVLVTAVLNFFISMLILQVLTKVSRTQVIPSLNY